MKTIKINKLFITVICFVFYFPTYSQNENFRNLAMSMLQYEVCMPFNDGVAPVLYDGRWGLIDTCGNEIFPCVLDFGIVQNYAKGVFVGLRMYNGDSGTKKIYITDYTNLIDKEGNVSTKSSYEEANMLPKYNDLKVRYNKITKTYCTRKGLR